MNEIDVDYEERQVPESLIIMSVVFVMFLTPGTLLGLQSLYRSFTSDFGAVALRNEGLFFGVLGLSVILLTIFSLYKDSKLLNFASLFSSVVLSVVGILLITG